MSTFTKKYISMDSDKFENNAFLSARELEIVELVVTGLSNLKIAQVLDISKRTVDNHISNILKKTHTDNRVELVRWSLQWGKVCIDDVNCCPLPEPEPTSPSKELTGEHQSPQTQSSLDARSLGESPTKRDKETSPGSHRFYGGVTVTHSHV